MLGLAAVLGAFVQAVVGLGMGLVAAPVVGILAPALVPALPLWLALLISGLMLARERAHIDWRSLAWALPGRVPGHRRRRVAGGSSSPRSRSGSPWP